MPRSTLHSQFVFVEHFLYYVSANKKLSLLPVALSLSVSYVSGIAMLGMPAEAYFFGIHMILTCVGTSTGALLAAYTFVPVMYETQTSSVNQVCRASSSLMALI